MKAKNKSVFSGMVVCALIFLMVSMASAATRDDLWNRYHQAFKGKKLVFITAAMMFEAIQAWEFTVRNEVKALGMEYELVDANMNPALLQQGLRAQIKKHPDVIVLHNLSHQQLGRDIEEAEKKGIHVLQVSLPSTYVSDVYCGQDFETLGREMAEEIVKVAGKGSGTSGKVIILPGSMSSYDTLVYERIKNEVFAKHPEIKVVLDQATDWQQSKGRELTAMALQQHPDLAAVWGYISLSTVGAGQAIREAGLLGKVKVITTGPGEKVTWDALESGLIDKCWVFNGVSIGRDLVNAVKMILQDGRKAGVKQFALFSNIVPLTKANFKNRKDLFYEVPK